MQTNMLGQLWQENTRMCFVALLLNYYLKVISIEVLKNKYEILDSKLRVINNKRYADDILVMTHHS